MSFGFSVGDCLTAILFIKGIVASLSNTHGSVAEFQELTTELANLQHTLGVIQSLPESEGRQGSIKAIKHTATDCQAVLDKYVRKFTKYRQSLGAGESDGKVKDAVKKVRWTLSMKQDVQVFRAYVAQHVATVNAQLGLENLYAMTGVLRSKNPLRRTEILLLSHPNRVEQIRSLFRTVSMNYVSM